MLIKCLSQSQSFQPFCHFLDALASLDLKLSVSEWVINVFTASASTGLSDYSRYSPIQVEHYKTVLATTESMLTSLQVRDQIKSKYQKHVFSKILCALSPYLVRWFSKSKSGFQASVESCEAEWKTKLDSATKVVILIIIIIFVIFITVIFFFMIIFNSTRSWLRLAGKRQVLRRRWLLLSKKSLRVQTLERWVWIVVLFAAVVVVVLVMILF